MVFLELSDFDSRIRSENLLNILDDDLSILDDSEALAIDYTIGFISGRYDTDEIFAQTGTDRSPLVVSFLLSFILSDIHSRINTRNVPERVQNDYERDSELLERINAQEFTPNLPLRLDEEGEKRNYLIVKTEEVKDYKLL